MKRIAITGIGILGLGLCLGVQANQPPSANGPHVSVDGQMVKFPDMQPRFMNNHVMVPIRGVFERLHANVDWNGDAHQVTCVNDQATVQLNLGDSEAVVNGRKILFDAPVTMSHGRTLVPLQFLAQSLGAHVQWDDGSQTVRIQSHNFTPRTQ